jgi:glucose/arabinose dehydrogenase
MRKKTFRPKVIVLGVASAFALPTGAYAATVANPICPAETANFAPDNGQDITVPTGFKVSVFASGLNMPTGIAFLGNASHFTVYVLESGHGLPSICNEQASFVGSAAANPFTPDIVVFDQNGSKIGGPLGKPGVAASALQPAEASRAGGCSRPTRTRPRTVAVRTAARASSSSIPRPAM